MKIIFDNDEEKERILKKFVESDSCPSEIWLKDSCTHGEGDCPKCWRAALGAIEGKE